MSRLTDDERTELIDQIIRERGEKSFYKSFKENATIPISTAITVGLMLFGWYVAFDKRMSSNELLNKEALRDRWTVPMMVDWTNYTWANNPSWKPTDVRVIQRNYEKTNQ